MILITGDTHGDFERLSRRNMRGILSENDYVIVAGDFGLVWANDKEFEYHTKIFANKPYTTLFIDGNHENFDTLNSYSTELWHGGKVHHIVKDKVVHLMRGQVFSIEDKKIFTFGGAQSHDIQGGILDKDDINFRLKVIKAKTKGLPYRVIGESWWKEEMPSNEEYEGGRINLEANNWQVDYIVTHSICNSMLPVISLILGIRKMETNSLTSYLEEIKNRTSYSKWYCGHYHTDNILDDNHEVLYKTFRELI